MALSVLRLALKLSTLSPPALSLPIFSLPFLSLPILSLGSGSEDYPPCYYGDNKVCYVHECESCDTTEGCILNEGWCRVNGICYQDGHIFTTKSGLSNCQICDIQRSNNSFSWAYTGTKCSNNLFCDGEDTCLYDENSKSSVCSVHSGNPCLENDFCNNTCSEKNKCYRMNSACGEESICSSKQCVNGYCTQTSYNEGGSCANETLCELSTCSNGECLTYSKPDLTSCGETTLCTSTYCMNGACVERPLVPPPHCNVCPCADGYECDDLSGLCNHINSDSNSKSPHSLGEVAYIAIITGSVILLISIVFVVLCLLRRRYIHKEDSLKFQLLKTEDDDFEEVIQGDNKTPVRVTHNTIYIRENEQPRIINKKN